MKTSPAGWAMAGLGCIAIAVVYAGLALRQRAGASFTLRWGHSLAWLLLAGWAAARAVALPDVVGSAFAVLAGVVYVAFLRQLVKSRRERG